MRQHGLAGDGIVGAHRDDDGDLPPPVIITSDNGEFGQPGHPAKHPFKLGRVDVLAARDDDMLQPVGEPVQPPIIDPRHIAGMEPAITDAVPAGGVIVPVAGQDVTAANPYFAHLADRHLAAVRASDADLAGASRAPDRAGGVKGDIGGLVDRRRRCFGGAIDLHHRGAAIMHRLDQRHRHVGRPDGHHAKAGQIRCSPFLLRQQRRQHCRHHRDLGDGMILDHGQRRGGVEERCDDHMRAAQQGWQRLDVQATDMEQRQDVQHHIIGRHRIGFMAHHGVRDHRRLRQRRALWPARGSRGVDDHQLGIGAAGGVGLGKLMPVPRRRKLGAKGDSRTG